MNSKTENLQASNENHSSKVRTRVQAAFVHLLISLAIFFLLLAIVIFWWYPSPLLQVGGITGLKLLVLVELVVGPLLTLIVYKQGKPGLKLDLSVIATIQACCLAYGVWVVHNERPIAQVLMHDGMHLVTLKDAKANQVNFKSFSGSSPKKIVMQLPEDASTWSTVVTTSEFIDGELFVFRSDLYQDHKNWQIDQVQNRIRLIQNRTPDWDNISSQLPSSDNCQWLPIFATHYEGYACVDAKSKILLLHNSI